MLIAFVESRPKLAGQGWEDHLLGRQEMAAPPQIGSVIRIASDEGQLMRYRAREIVYDLPNGGADAERIADRELCIYVVLIAHVGSPILNPPACVAETKLFNES